MEKIKDLKERFLSWYSDLGKSERKKLLELVVYAVIGLLLFAWFFVGCVDVAKASTLSGEVSSIPLTEELSKTTPHYVVFWSEPDNAYYCLLYDRDWQGGATVHVPASFDGYEHFMTCRTLRVYKYNSGTWDYVKGGSNMLPSYTVTRYLYADETLYVCGSPGTVFFPPAPFQTPLGVTGAEMAQTLTAELIGVVPLLVGFLILVISLWKGLGSLYRLLKTA